MGFTTPCFIRKNTEELRKRLEELGYSLCPGRDLDQKCLATSASHRQYMSISEKMYDSTNQHVTYNCANRKDCGTNESLFLAIAALRDDTDNGQWFVMDVEIYVDIPEGTWFQSTDRDGGKHVGTQIEALYCHKATVEELFGHFNMKNIQK